MRTYLNELRGQVRGNHRLRNKIRKLEQELTTIKRAAAFLINDCDGGRVPHQVYVNALAWSIGWRRDT